MARIAKKSTYTDLGRSFDLAFQQSMSIGPADQSRSLPLHDALVRQVYKDALDESLPAIRQILFIARMNDRERTKHLFRRLDPRPYKTPTVVTGYPAMRLLDVVRKPADQFEIQFGIAPWVIEAAAEHAGLSDMKSNKLIQDHVCHPGKECGEPYQLDVDPLYRTPAPKRPAGSTRFQKGQSGNPAGRPRKKKLELPFDGFLEEKVEVTINGEVRCISRIQFLIQHLHLKALKGHKGIRKILLEASNAELLERWQREERRLIRITYGDDAESDDTVLAALRYLKVVNRRSKKFVLLEPWIVELAVRRLAPHALSDAEQKVVVRATSTPAKVAWPDWWSPNLRSRAALQPGEPRVISQQMNSDNAW